MNRSATPADADETRAVLSVQSHVVHGYVGNKAATFPLQLRGWDVDALNAVQFSNHTGYGSFRGARLDGAAVDELYAGLTAQGFRYDALLTGYLPSASVVDAVGRLGADLRRRNPDAVWLLDPVMGDEGRLYVKEDVVPAYKRILAADGLVTITTPNHYEVELLTGIALRTRADVLRALATLHADFGVPHVVISSLPHPTDPTKLLSVGSSARVAGPPASRAVEQLAPPFVIVQEKLDSYFTGTGDLFAALLLDNFARLGETQLAQATATTVSVLRKVLHRTWDYSRRHHAGGARIQDPSMKYHELRLVQAAPELRETEASPDVEWADY